MSWFSDAAAAAMRRTILAIAVPSMLTNVATALFGLADMWVIGRLGDAFSLFFVARAAGQALLLPILTRRSFALPTTGPWPAAGYQERS
jgi:Na+-driven multidrug efflux pump